MMNKLKCIAIDDEPLALQIIENYVQQIDYLSLVATYRKPLEAIDYLGQQDVDLVFLDIQMPQLNGLDFFRALQKPPMVIFTTAFREFAVESYELNAIDYLLKPISFPRFLKATQKAYGLLANTAAEAQQEEEIFIKAENKIFKVKPQDICYVESFKDYVVIHLQNQNSLTSYQQLGQFEKQLNGKDFLRIHRSFVINLTYVNAFDSSFVYLQDKMLPIGKTYKAQVQEVLKIK